MFSLHLSPPHLATLLTYALPRIVGNVCLASLLTVTGTEPGLAVNQDSGRRNDTLLDGPWRAGSGQRAAGTTTGTGSSYSSLRRSERRVRGGRLSGSRRCQHPSQDHRETNERPVGDASCAPRTGMARWRWRWCQHCCRQTID
ncbi:hypothetical protein EV127DRAFT_210753 [Xylaria flabelliformis]|nr:hypothetical protein EV127DRAFT_210753 [Xylaria flabelliformis]